MRGINSYSLFLVTVVVIASKRQCERLSTLLGLVYSVVRQEKIQTAWLFTRYLQGCIVLTETNQFYPATSLIVEFVSTLRQQGIEKGILFQRGFHNGSSGSASCQG